MRNPLTGVDTKDLDRQIQMTLDAMTKEGVDSEKYPKLIQNLERLYKLKQQEKPKRVSRDTMWMVGGNCLIAIFVLAFEQKHVWTSKIPVPTNRHGNPT